MVGALRRRPFAFWWIWRRGLQRMRYGGFEVVDERVASSPTRHTSPRAPKRGGCCRECLCHRAPMMGRPVVSTVL